jgi:diguanylate cyclase (GGDEF)-like protein
MLQKPIRILLIESKDEQFISLRNLFSSMQDLSFEFERELSLQKGQEEIRENYYDICVTDQQLVDFEEKDFLKNIKNTNPLMQIWFLADLDKEFVDLTIFEVKSNDFIMKCQFHRDTISSGIHFILGSYGLRRQLESQIQDHKTSESNFLTMANTNLDGLLILDKNGTVIYCNPSAGQVYNCSQEELIGKQLGIPMTKGEKVILDLVRRDGANSIVEARFANINWTNQDAYLVSLRDITEQERLLEALHKASAYDDLTNLYNRREANCFLQDEIEQCKRYNRSSSLLMFDIDNFKKINDTYGHTIGDKALQWISKIINNKIRTVDKFARFGGDEFLVLLPSIVSESALVPASRICKAILDQPCPINLPENKVFLLPLTFSMGVAEIPKDGDSLEAIIKAVDSALYLAKDRGGNCAVLYMTSEIKKGNQENE